MRTIDDLVRGRPEAAGPRLFVRQEPLATYLARADYLSSSTLRRAWRENGPSPRARSDDDPGQRLAHALHALVLEPARFARDYVVLSGAAAAAADQIEAADSVWLTPAEHAALVGTRDAIRAWPRAPLGRWFEEGMRELSIYWTDEAGRRWKARPDCFTEDIVLELKTTGDVRPRAFARVRRRFGYDLQAAHYLDAVRRLTGRTPRFAFVAAELAPPHYVWLHELTDADLARARAELGAVRERIAPARA